MLFLRFREHVDERVKSVGDAERVADGQTDVTGVDVDTENIYSCQNCHTCFKLSHVF